MSYFEEIDAWLAEYLGIPDGDIEQEELFAEFKTELKAKLLESYRNGQKAGLQPEKPGRALKQETKPRKLWLRRRSQGRQ